MTSVFEALHLIKIKYNTDSIQLASRAIDRCLQLPENGPPIWIIRNEWRLSFSIALEENNQSVLIEKKIWFNTLTRSNES